MPRRRLGVVLLVPPPWAAEIDGLRRALGDGALGRIPPHLTLVPPVNVREDDVPAALAVLRAAAATNDGPLPVRLGPAGTFSAENPVVYRAVDGDVQSIRDAVFHPPHERPLTWPFHPHVTLADEVTSVPRIEAAVAALADYVIDVAFDGVALLEETDGRVWRPLAVAPFERPSVVGRGGGLEVTLDRSSMLDAEAAAWTDAAWARYSMAEYGIADEDEPFAIVARRAGAVVGTATGVSRGDELSLARLVVAEGERRTGVGSHLLAAVESLAAERGCSRLTLRTLADGPARGLYERRGWRVYADLPRWREGRDFVQMERLLG
jgi:2'-5' RNA ligase/ribosomal protein S18 acetylase RimI-like enzyme